MSKHKELRRILQNDDVNVEEAVKDVMRIKSINPDIDTKSVKVSTCYFNRLGLRVEIISETRIISAVFVVVLDYFSSHCPICNKIFQFIYCSPIFRFHLMMTKCLHQICGYKELLRVIEITRKEPYSSDNPKHEILLLQVCKIFIKT